MTFLSPDIRRKGKSRANFPLVSAVLLLCLFLAPHPAPAEDSPKAPAEDRKIRITSDSLEAEMSEGKSRWTEFIGNVVAAQGDTVIEADRLRIYIEKSGENGGGPAGGNSSVEKVVASGNVRIEFEDTRAETDKAVYTTKDKVLVLTGTDSSIRNGPNRLTGSKITLYRETGRINVRGKGANRVKAVFFPTDGGLE